MFCRHIYPQVLKESSMMRTGKATDVVDKLHDVKTMLNAIKDLEYDEFWKYNEDLGEHKLEDLKFFPVRVAINKCYHPLMSTKEKSKQDDKYNMMVIQRPLAVNNKDISIGEYLIRVLPKYFHVQTDITVDEDDDEDEENKKEDEEIDYVERTKKGTEVIINGISIELDISLMWLVLNLSALDNFLYITINLPE